MLQRTYAIATWPLFFALLGTCLLFVFVIFPLFGEDYPTHSFDRRSGQFAPSHAPEILKAFDDADQLDRYRLQELGPDVLFPIAYGLGLAVWIALLIPATSRARYLVLVPYLTAAADYLENFAVVSMIDRFDKADYTTYAELCRAAGWVKGAGLMLSIAIVIGAAVFRRVR